MINLQRKVKIDTKAIQDFAKTLVETVDETSGRSFAVALVSDQRMTDLNRIFRGKESTTDVLSFANEPEAFESGIPDNLGDIVISCEQAQRQALEARLTVENEIKQLMLHGLLHLCGFDHETDSGEMNARELELRDKLGI